MWRGIYVVPLGLSLLGLFSLRFIIRLPVGRLVSRWWQRG